MNLAPEQTERFFTIFRSLLAFVNEQRQIVPDKVGKIGSPIFIRRKRPVDNFFRPRRLVFFLGDIA